MTETPEKALDMAKASDARLAKGEGGPLEGLPLGIKDLYCTEGVAHAGRQPHPRRLQAHIRITVTANLWRDGAVMLGKLNMDEFAMGSSNETSYYGPVASPWRRERDDGEGAPRSTATRGSVVPGGSSGGSAAAVAAHLCLGATATDTGGSIRQPAAFTGRSASSRPMGAARAGAWSPSPRRSTRPGRIARTVRDCAIMLRSMAGHDPKDTTSVDTPVPDYEKRSAHRSRARRSACRRNIASTACRPRSRSCGSKGIELPARRRRARSSTSPCRTRKYALPAYYIVAPAEASSNLARYDGVRYGCACPARTSSDMYEKTRADGFGEEVRRRIMIGTYVLSAGYYDAYYVRAQKIRTLIKPRFREAYRARRRRHPDARDAVGRLRHRREGRRSGRDVSQRHLHGDGEHGGPAGHRRAGRACRATACRSACN